MFKRRNVLPENVEPKNDEYVSKVAPAALALDHDHIRFPHASLLPLTARAAGIPGMNERPWSKMNWNVFYGDAPAVYSVSLRRELPDTMKSSIRARRHCRKVC